MEAGNVKRKSKVLATCAINKSNISHISTIFTHNCIKEGLQGSWKMCCMHPLKWEGVSGWSQVSDAQSMVFPAERTKRNA